MRASSFYNQRLQTVKELNKVAFEQLNILFTNSIQNVKQINNLLFHFDELLHQVGLLLDNLHINLHFVFLFYLPFASIVVRQLFTVQSLFPLEVFNLYLACLVDPADGVLKRCEIERSVLDVWLLVSNPFPV